MSRASVSAALFVTVTASGVFAVQSDPPALGRRIDTSRGVLPPGAGERAGAVIDLGTLGGASAAAHAINTWGTIAGESTIADETRRPFLTVPGAPMHRLRVFDDGDSRAFALNDWTEVVGRGIAADGEDHGFRLNATSVLDLGDAWPLTISNAGDAAGWQNRPLFPSPVAWRHDGRPRVLTPGGKRGEALDANARGQIVGWYADPDQPLQAVIWQPDGRITELDTGDAIASVATSINENGDVAGFRYMADGRAHAFLWREGAGISDLLPSHLESLALDLNDAGQVVGTLHEHRPDGSATSTAFLWSADAPVVSLRTPVDGAATASSINELGEIVGWVSEPLEGPSHALWWYEPPTIETEFTAIRQVLALLAEDEVIGRGHATALTRHLRAMERAWAAGHERAAAQAARLLAAQLRRVTSDPRRTVRLVALLERLALRLES